MNKCSIITELKKVEDDIKETLQRIDTMEHRLNNGDLPSEKTDEIRSELKDLRTLLEINEKKLGTIHGHNRQTFAVSAVLFFICFLVYGLYVLISGPDF